MKTKICNKCKKEKSIEDFAINNTRKDGRNSTCKECFRIYRNNHYQENKQYYKDKAKKYKQNTREAFNIFKAGLKCSNCGESRWWLLDFHHLDPTEKEREVVNLVQSPRKLEKELQKCIVLCSNCHRDLHYREKNKSI